MKKLFDFFCTVIILQLIASPVYSQNLAKKLDKLSKQYVFTYEKLETDTFFKEKYVLYFNQAIDHNNPQSPNFSQRVFISHRGFNQPVVFITEGYDAGYAANPKYINELTEILNASQVCVEHRYFGESVPDPLEWQYLTIYNAATDHHKIVEVIKHIYPGKWINTGISKGGQTTMYHRYFYPKDVDVSVGYVCPLNFSIEDQRVYKFLDQVGDSSCRKNIFEYQLHMLENKSIYLEEFKTLASKKNLNYNMEPIEAYELTVLEYPFAFWQWGTTNCNAIPGSDSSEEILIDHLDQVAGIEWISEEGIERLQPFFYQALFEIGFYGYDISPFSGYLSFQSNPTFDFTAPKGILIQYDPEPMQKVDHFIRHEAENMIFIYGEYDPWSATAVDLTHNTNSIIVVKPKGSHRTRINNLPDSLRNYTIETLKNWLEINTD